MPSPTTLSYRLPDDSHRVPRDSGGIYQFAVRFPSNYELGLTHQAPDLDLIKATAKSYLLQVAPAFGLLGLTGSLHSDVTAHHLRVAFKINTIRTDLLAVERAVKKLFDRHVTDLQQLRSVIRATQHAFAIAPPIYIGIASEQSLGARLDQHLSDSTGLAIRLRVLKLNWSNLEYRCTPMDTSDGVALRPLENALQAIFKPQLSDR